MAKTVKTHGLAPIELQAEVVVSEVAIHIKQLMEHPAQTIMAA